VVSRYNFPDLTRREFVQMGAGVAALTATGTAWSAVNAPTRNFEHGEPLSRQRQSEIPVGDNLKWTMDVLLWTCPYLGKRVPSLVLARNSYRRRPGQLASLSPYKVVSNLGSGRVTWESPECHGPWGYPQ
jgi:hypothetical protein